MKSEHTSSERALENPPSEAEEIVAAEQTALLPEEINGPKGPEPTRFGDWERKGRCIDF